MRTRRLLILIAAAALAVALTPAASAEARSAGQLIMADYDLRLSVSMQSDFSFQPVVTDCGPVAYPEGYSAKGQEILTMRSPKPVRVQLLSSPGSTSIAPKRSLRYTYPLVGETRRTGQATSFYCGDTRPTMIDRCVGRFPLKLDAEISFLGNGTKVLMSGQPSPSTRDQIPACGDDILFDWDSAVARTGTVLLEPGKGSAPRSKLKAKSFTLTGTARDNCAVGDFGQGSCATSWTWKANLRKVKRRG
jgi:hypothetical protein